MTESTAAFVGKLQKGKKRRRGPKGNGKKVIQTYSNPEKNVYLFREKGDRSRWKGGGKDVRYREGGSLIKPLILPQDAPKGREGVGEQVAATGTPKIGLFA